MTGNELKQQRERLGLTQRELAAHLGVVVATVSMWESGAAPIPAHRARLIALDLRGLRPRKRIERRGRPRKSLPTAE